MTFVVLAGLGLGCNSDDVVGDATAEAVEHGLDDALQETVVPLVGFMGAIPGIVNGGALRAGLGVTCPSTAGVCGSGSVVCTVTGGSTTLTFDFDQCVVVTGDAALTLDGVVVATPGDPIGLQFQNFFLTDTSNPINGTGSVSVANCSYTVHVSDNDDTAVDGTIIQCDTDNYPTNQSNLDITLNDVLVTITFDGSNIANAVAFSGKNEIADCNINLANNPISSSCEAP